MTAKWKTDMTILSNECLSEQWTSVNIAYKKVGDFAIGIKNKDIQYKSLRFKL